MSTTTLYTTGNTPNVQSNNFTTLYNGVQTVSVNTSYGNANVEAFLNTGTDGSNSVQNIVMSGNLSVGGNSNLGNISNVHITGGSLNYVLETDGAGHLNWVALPNFQTNTTSYTHFDVTSTGNNQTFTDSNLIVYANSYTMSVFKNGVNIEPTQYNITGNVLTINVLLNTGDTIDVLPSYSGAPNTTPGGNLTEVQYNGGSGILSGNSSFTFDQGNSKLSVGNIDTGNIYLNGNSEIYSDLTTLQLFANKNHVDTAVYLDKDNLFFYANTNVKIETNTNGTQYDWTFLPDGNIKFPDGTYQNTAFVGGSTSVAGSNTQVQFNNNGAFGASANFRFNNTTNTLTVPNIVGNITNANFATTSLTSISATNAGNSNYSNTANIANYANYSNFSGQVINSNQSNITSLGNLLNLTSNGNVIFDNASNVSLGSISNLHISGGVANQYLQTDGTGNLTWSTVSGGSSNVFANGISLTNNSNIDIFNGPSIGSGLGFANINAQGIFYLSDLGCYPYTSYFIDCSTYNARIDFLGNTRFNQALTPGVTYTTHLGNIPYVKINGGSSGQVISTDGNSNLSFTNTIQYANVANSVNGGNVSGPVANANYASNSNALSSTNPYTFTNSTLGFGPGYPKMIVLSCDSGNGAILASGSTDGNLVLGANAQYSTGPTQRWTFTSTGNLVLPGNTFSVNFANGSQAVIPNANYAAYAGNITIAAQPNITSTGTLTSLTVSGNITTGNISSTGLSNIANTKFTKFNETVVNGGSVSGTLTPDASVGTIYQYTLTGSITLNSLLNAVAGTSMTIELTQGGSGSYTLSSTMKFASGNKTLSTSVGAVDIISLYYNGTTYYAVLSKGYV